jgi:adenylate cyclase
MRAAMLTPEIGGGIGLLAVPLGDVQVQSLISRFFFDIAEPIAQFRGETHRYIGDEVVVTWPLEHGVHDARCLRCVMAIHDLIKRNASVYQKLFGVTPTFRTALHCGDVVAGEVGDDKREIVYFGDTINTAARLAAHCKVAGESLLISRDILDAVTVPTVLAARLLGPVGLRGKSQDIEVFALDLEASSRTQRLRS